MIRWKAMLPVYRATFPFREKEGNKRRWGIRIPHEGGVLLAYGTSQRVGAQTASTAVLRLAEELALAGLLVPTRFEFGEIFLFDAGVGELHRCGSVSFERVKIQAKWMERNSKDVLDKALRVRKMEG